MRIRITNPTISTFQIDKIAGRKNIGTWLTNKGITDWSYDFGELWFIATVPDDYDLNLLSEWGTVEVLEDGT